MKQAIEWLENTTYIERYSWFDAFKGTDGNYMIDMNGTLTTIGKYYLHG